ncbi:hypothetical protein L9G74_21030, partial [Shewanella sp. C32]
ASIKKIVMLSCLSGAPGSLRAGGTHRCHFKAFQGDIIRLQSHLWRQPIQRATTICASAARRSTAAHSRFWFVIFANRSAEMTAEQIT